MNTSMKHWREAATLVLAARRRLGAGTLSSGSPETSGGTQLSDICGPTHLPHTSQFDHNVLLLKRSSKSGFMPDAYVFPGGVVDPSDFSREWLDIFTSFSHSPNFGLRRVTQPPESRPPIFATDRLKLGSAVPGEVAFRICALRETFEESGVLLVVSNKHSPSKSEEVKGMLDLCKVYELSCRDLTKWRDLVNQHPSNFIRMCRELEVMPNIWALHEWSNWLTPIGSGARRFDTAFYICCLQETPLHTLQDQAEVVRFQWSTPTEVLQSHHAGELWIPPPQFYEFSRLCRFPSLNDLHSFASQRATEGCEHWLPVVFAKDGQYISLLPGDKLYPLDGSGQAPINSGTDSQPEETQDSSELHRMVILNTHNIKLQVTIKPKYNHLLPVMEPSWSHDSKM